MTWAPFVLLSILAVTVLVTVVCAAVRLFKLEHVDLHANMWKLATLSFSVKNQPPEEKPAQQAGIRKRRAKLSGPRD
jgi:hypothetical protein